MLLLLRTWFIYYIGSKSVELHKFSHIYYKYVGYPRLKCNCFFDFIINQWNYFMSVELKTTRQQFGFDSQKFRDQSTQSTEPHLSTIKV